MTAPSSRANEITEQDAEILKRLRRIEGQVRGLQQMLEQGRECDDLLIQLSGVRSALDAAGELVLEQYAAHCHVEGEKVTPADVVRAVRLLRR